MSRSACFIRLAVLTIAVARPLTAEVYSGRSVPGDFMDLLDGRPCGAVVLWTGP